MARENIKARAQVMSRAMRELSARERESLLRVSYNCACALYTRAAEDEWKGRLRTIRIILAGALIIRF